MRCHEKKLLTLATVGLVGDELPLSTLLSKRDQQISQKSAYFRFTIYACIFSSYNRKDYGCYPKAFVFGENNIPKQFETVPFTKP